MLQYGALRRKIGGTYRDFFKDSVEGESSNTLELGFSLVISNFFKCQLLHIYASSFSRTTGEDYALIENVLHVYCPG
jgi:hypothetical protein